MLMRTTGGVVSRNTVALSCPTAPDGSVAVTVSIFLDSRKMTPGIENELPVTVAGTPLMATIAFASSTVPDTVMGLALKSVSGAGELICILGGLTPLNEKLLVELFP